MKDVNEKKSEILANFDPEFIEKYYETDPMFQAVVERLTLHPEHIYKVIQILISSRISLLEITKRLPEILNDPIFKKDKSTLD